MNGQGNEYHVCDSGYRPDCTGDVADFDFQFYPHSCMNYSIDRHEYYIYSITCTSALVITMLHKINNIISESATALSESATALSESATALSM